MTNIRETEARTRKAMRLADAAMAAFPQDDPRDVAQALAGLSDVQWGTLAAVAKVNPPSEASKSATLVILRERGNPVDPFWGLT